MDNKQKEIAQHIANMKKGLKKEHFDVLAKAFKHGLTAISVDWDKQVKGSYIEALKWAKAAGQAKANGDIKTASAYMVNAKFTMAVYVKTHNKMVV